MEGADSRLRLYQIELLDYDSILAAVDGCAGVFHLASPCIVDKVQDPQVVYFYLYSVFGFRLWSSNLFKFSNLRTEGASGSCN